MKVYLKDQQFNFPAHLEFMKMQPVIDYDIAGLTEKTSSIVINTNKKLVEARINETCHHQRFEMGSQFRRYRRNRQRKSER